MSDLFDLELEHRFAAYAEPVSPDFAAVRVRADELRQPQRRGVVRRRVVTLASAVLALAIAATALSKLYLGPSPALTAGVSSLHQLPSVDPVPESVASSLPQLAASVGISTSDAVSQVKLLQTSLPTGNLYGFAGAGDSACFILEQRGGACLSDPHLGAPGVLWAVLPGYPGDPTAVVGVVADNVTKLVLNTPTRSIELPIVNNSFYGDYTVDTDSVTLLVTYGDGTTATLTL